jgi:5-methylcytosine-specific restriction endonuclease McrA
MVTDLDRRPAWGGRYAAALTAATLARDHDPDAGYTPCYWCGERADTADHFPVARCDGGPDLLANLVPACRSCNSRRGARMVNARRQGVTVQPSRRW